VIPRFFTLTLFLVSAILAGCSTDSAAVTEPEAGLAGFIVPVRELNDRVSVMTWKNGAAAALSLTFDDGTEDHYRIAAPIMEKHGFRGTFFLTVGSIGSGVWIHGTWKGFLDLYESGHELGSHTMTHPWLTKITADKQQDELLRAKEEIETRTGNPCLSFAYPYCDHNPAVEQFCRDLYASSRTGRFNPDNPVWNLPTPDDWSLIVSYTPWFGTAPRTSPARDIPVLTQAKEAVNAAVEQNGWAVVMLHSVVPFKEIVPGGYMNDLTVSDDWFDSFCSRLAVETARGALWVDTMGHVTRYIRERDSAELTGYTETVDGCRFTLTDNLDDAVYNLPLTVQVIIPGEFNAARLTDPRGEVIRLETGTDAGNTIRFSVVPDSGEYLLVYGDS
jgi:peptidoglycan/xylan/chitin deacetylase (PgdA/CDA1 family)